MNIKVLSSYPSFRTVLITGSSGKTNCRELIRQILTKAGYLVECMDFADVLQYASPDADFVLVCADFDELSQITIEPDLVVVTNVSSYPLKYYHRYRDLLGDLGHFFAGLSPVTRRVGNFDYQFLRTELKEEKEGKEQILFRLNGVLEKGVWISENGEIIMGGYGNTQEPQKILHLKELLLQGERNQGIYLAAIAASGFYADPAVIREACAQFTGHRAHFCCYLLDRNRRLYMQLNTGLPSLAEAAFVGFTERLVIVTGHMGVGNPDQSYQGLALMLLAYAKRLILFGEDADLIGYAVKKIRVNKSYDLPVFVRKTADEALRYALDTGRDNDWILFTPIDGKPGLFYDEQKRRFVVPEQEMSQ